MDTRPTFHNIEYIQRKFDDIKENGSTIIASETLRDVLIMYGNERGMPLSYVKTGTYYKVFKK